jgi:hypothetical protein
MTKRPDNAVPSAFGADLPSSEARSQGEVLAVTVEGLAEDGSAPEPLPTTTDVLQLAMLRAIYYELRHGHDIQAAHTAAIDRLVARLGER